MGDEGDTKYPVGNAGDKRRGATRSIERARSGAADQGRQRSGMN